MDTTIDETRAERRIVFVGGLHRSGTTLIADLLARHPAIGGMDRPGESPGESKEVQYLQDVLPREDAFGGPGLIAFNGGFSDPVGLAAPGETARRLHRAWETHWPADPRLCSKRRRATFSGRRSSTACFRAPASYS